jgi:drug/metabolite transporter (DMT)-like permease
MKNRKVWNALPHLGLFLVYVLWGINISSMKIGGREWDPIMFNGLRYLSIIPILWAYTYVYYRKRSLRLWISRKDLGLILGLGILSAVGMEVLLSYALQYSNAANGAVLGRGLMPLVTVIISLYFHQIRFTWRMMVGLPVAFVCVIMIVSGGEAGFHLGPETLRGDVLLLLRSVLGAVYLIGMNRLVVKYPLPLLVSLEMSAGAAILLPYVIWRFNAETLLAMAPAGWYSLVYTAVFATLLGFAIHNWSLGRLGAYKSSVYGYFLPVSGAIAGLFILGEKLSTPQIVGGLGVLLAMYMVQRDRMQPTAQASPASRAAVFTENE